MGDLLFSTRRQADAKITEEVIDGLGGLGHLVFNSESSVVRIAEEARCLIAEFNGLLEERYILVDLNENLQG